MPGAAIGEERPIVAAPPPRSDSRPVAQCGVSERADAHAVGFRRAEHPTLEDYRGRRVVIDKTVFASHTTGSHAMRVALLEALPDVLKNPDEVWLNDYATRQFNRLHFIKFYDGKVIDVICEVTEDLEYRIATWFEIRANPKINRSALKKAEKSTREKDPRWLYRRGLLIKK